MRAREQHKEKNQKKVKDKGKNPLITPQSLRGSLRSLKKVGSAWKTLQRSQSSLRGFAFAHQEEKEKGRIPFDPSIGRCFINANKKDLSVFLSFFVKIYVFDLIELRMALKNLICKNTM